MTWTTCGSGNRCQGLQFPQALPPLPDAILNRILDTALVHGVPRRYAQLDLGADRRSGRDFRTELDALVRGEARPEFVLAPHRSIRRCVVRGSRKLTRAGNPSDDDRGGSRGGSCSVLSAADASSPQSCATSERATSTLLTPLREQYHKYAVVSHWLGALISDLGSDVESRCGPIDDSTKVAPWVRTFLERRYLPWVIWL